MNVGPAPAAGESATRGVCLYVRCDTVRPVDAGAVNSNIRRRDVIRHSRQEVKYGTSARISKQTLVTAANNTICPPFTPAYAR